MKILRNMDSILKWILWIPPLYRKINLIHGKISLILQWIFWIPLVIIKLIFIVCIGWFAVDIRMYAIRTFGLVIHEFDPWFNFRSTQYLADNGWAKFFKWYDYRSWYPLGRPVGTTIYPGMQIMSVWGWRLLNYVGVPISLNDVCCYVPCFGGLTATIFLGLLTLECTGSINSAIVSAGVMAIIPAHLMRSVGGGYDNESVAMTAICMTFWLWCRSLRTPKSWPIGILAGLAYFYMVAAWGGYVFVLNMVGVHAFGLIALGNYSTKLYRSYSLFFFIGTLGAIQVPVVGWTPLRSLEQICPLILFFGFQLLEFCQIVRRKKELSFIKFQIFRVLMFSIAALLLASVTYLLNSMGYFGPISARIRGLFLKHTRTGNPLVDSVAEHQPSNANAYEHYLQETYKVAPAGFLLVLIPHIFRNLINLLTFLCKRNYKKEEEDVNFKTRNDASWFLVFYAIVAFYFSKKMARLIILLGPIASALTGVAFGVLLDWAESQFFGYYDVEVSSDDSSEEVSQTGKSTKKKAASSKPPQNAQKKGNKKEKSKIEQRVQGQKKPVPKAAKNPNKKQSIFKKAGQETKKELAKETKKKDIVVPDVKESTWRMPAKYFLIFYKFLVNVYRFFLTRTLCKLLTFAIIWGTYVFARDFNNSAQAKVPSLSQPSLMFKANLKSGEEIIVDDYREAYWWLRDHTPPDSRVMAWWDYGYQIAGIGNRTTIADGNTWNHEHIALLGRCLSSPEKRAHRIIRHLADYVLIWTGGGGDDLAKSPHMARIGNSVFDDICPGDPTCRRFGIDHNGRPTPMMAASLLYKLHSSRIKPGVTVDPNRFREVFSSKFMKVRIYKVLKVSRKSKRWIADPKNRVCDAPGSWYCNGQYPPALNKVLAKRKSFSQLEDFNKKRDAKADAYHKLYHEKMGT